MTTLTLKLTRAARKHGGDRYEFGKKGDPDFIVLYFPQSISREEGGKIKKELKVTIS